MDAGFKEMSVQQLDHMWQNSYSKEFNEWSPSFSTDGWFEEQTGIDITTIDTTVVENFYIKCDTVCDPVVNLAILNTVPSQVLYTEYVRDDLNHVNVIGAVDNTDFMTTLMAALTSGITCPADD